MFGYGENKMIKPVKEKKIKLYFLVIFIIVICFIILSLFRFYTKQEQKKNLLYCQEYVVGKGNIKGKINSQYYYKKNKNFEIGANFYGYAVFKNPNIAFKEMEKNYKDGIKLIQHEFNLKPLSKQNYELYKAYGDQVFSDVGTKEEQQQASFISEFLDIYENSYLMQ